MVIRELIIHKGNRYVLTEAGRGVLSKHWARGPVDTLRMDDPSPRTGHPAVTAIPVLRDWHEPACRRSTPRAWERRW
jgi:hypothetical protein